MKKNKHIKGVPKVIAINVSPIKIEITPVDIHKNKYDPNHHKSSIN